MTEVKWRQEAAEMENEAPASDAILIPGSSASSSTSLPPTKIICRVCQKQFSKYTCPRCNARYCSLQCYQKHSLHCTESFMRDNVMGEMRQLRPDSETKRKMMEMLKRIHLEEEAGNEEDDKEDGDSFLSEETVQKILSGKDVSLKVLSPGEMKRFQRAMASGELSKLIEPWEPWWLKLSARTVLLGYNGARLVRPVEEEVKETSAPQSGEFHLSEVPPGPENPLPPLSKLVKGASSPLLVVHLLDILYSYCFTLRLYNGDWRSDALEAAMVVLSMSSVFGEGGQPETVAEVLGRCLEQACSPMHRHVGGVQFGLGLYDDVVALLFLGKHALVCLLCDLQRLLLAGERMFKSEMRRKGRMGVTREKLRHAERKVYFMMCWVHEQPGQVWESLAHLVRVEKASFMSKNKGMASAVEEAKLGSESKLLIEEV